VTFSDWLGIGGIVVGLGSAFYFYYAARLVPAPKYLLRSVPIISEEQHAKAPGLEVRVLGQHVKALWSTRVVFFNSGRGTLLGTSIVETDPLRFVVEPGGTILHTVLLRQSRRASGCALSIEGHALNEQLIIFDYLERNDSLTFEVLHTSPVATPPLIGSIRGVPAGPHRVQPSEGSRYLLVPSWAMFGSAISATIVSLLHVSDARWSIQLPAWTGALLLGGVVVAGVVEWGVSASRRRHTRQLLGS